MHNRSHRAFHLRKVLRFTRIVDQPAKLDDFILIAMISTHSLVSRLQSSPGFLGHRCIEGVAELEANLLRDAFFLGQLLKGRKMRHLMPDELHGTITSVKLRPDRVARVGVWSQLSALA